ncbi:MAG: RDD family protein [Propionibacteriaceae bacterium]|nr:RDD family protein [Propionibacteriaceae bacterium]
MASAEEETAEFPPFTLVPWSRRALGWLINWLVPFFLTNLTLNWIIFGQRETEIQASSTTLWSFVIVCVVSGALSKAGQMPGHRVMRIQVINLSGVPVSKPKQIFRNLAHSVDWFFLGIGWLLPLWDRRGQTLADKIAGTCVVDVTAGTHPPRVHH